MADTKISDLTDGTTPDTADVFPAARAGANVKLSWAELIAAASVPPASALATHEADTTNIHGITNTATLETTTGAQAKADAAQAASQPVDSDLTAIAALTTTSYGRALLALADAAAARTVLALGTAATAATGDFDAAGAASAAQAASQPVDSDLTAIAALTTTSYGRAFLALADAAAGRTALGLGSAAVAATGDFDAAGAAAAAQSASQPLDSDLTAFAGLAIASDKLPYGTGSHTLGLADFTAAGRALVDDTDAAAQRTTLGLVIGTNVQAYDADLTTWAGLTPSAFFQTIVDDADAPTVRATIKARDRLPQSFLSGIIAESFDRVLGNTNSTLLTSARLSSVGIPVLAGDVITSVSWHSATTALSAGANRWFALCDSSLNVIRQSTDQLTTGWASNTLMTTAVDSVPTTAGARAGSTTVTLTIPTLSQALSALFTAGDSIVVSNANVAAYNGTFTVASVSATQITYVCGGSATDSLVAPFPTVQMAAGKRTYTVPTTGLVYAVIMVKATVPTLTCYTGTTATSSDASASGVVTLASSGNTSLTGTCPSPITNGTGTGGLVPWAGVS